MLLELLIYLIAVQFIIISHELGHAAFGRRFGIKHIHLIAGMGKVLWQHNGFELRLFPIGGRCRFDEESHNKLTRLQKATIALAGPAVNFITAYIMYALNAPEIIWKIALVLGVMNLVPVPRSDGWQLLMQIINKPNLATFALNPWVAEGIVVTIGLTIMFY